MNFHGKLLFPEIQILQLPPLEYLDGKQRSLNSGVVKFQGRAVPSSLINLSTAESPYQGWNLSCWCFLPGARLLLELETHTHSRCGFFPAGSLTDAKRVPFQVGSPSAPAFVEFSKTVPSSADFSLQEEGAEVGAGSRGGGRRGGEEPGTRRRSGGSGSHLCTRRAEQRFLPSSAEMGRRSNSQPPFGTPLPAAKV